MALILNGNGTVDTGTMVFGNGDITGLSAGALPSNVIGAGGVLQVVQTFKTDVFSTSSSSFTDITGFSVSITASSSSNKILLLISATGGTTSDCEIQAVRTIGGSSVVIGSSTSASSANGFGQWSAITGAFPMTLMYLDSPSTTSAITYKAQVAQVNSGTFYLNRRAYANDFGSSSTITVMEIAA